MKFMKVNLELYLIIEKWLITHRKPHYFKYWGFLFSTKLKYLTFYSVYFYEAIGKNYKGRLFSILNIYSAIFTENLKKE